ncbi:LysR family transcriptional regulator [Actinosynnema sp. NPDC047251]|uniref:Transcriptional regulator, LysR family n=1 Tax=Saccharothrix espanaensis (strain ATCC 51144 / DSM 44229 / JCM 9112 / NBRC 15066 / NRRL 15764) TaxID=1179773 RepID=K0JUL8_SACES|nr:LysR family transcriptional regulator [Saccharothrix espanaensis]CCH27928.1 Transcriptional regulator, LysR family [Saccharothrix espanaensis DSM 44229]
MPELELRHLRAVCAIAEEGSLTKAAIRLGLTQPAMSAQLRTVERIVGGQLFDRTPGGSVATDLGKQVVGTARLVLDEVEQLVSLAKEKTRDGTPGPLIVGGVPTLFFGHFVEELRRTIPCSEIRTEIAPGGSDLLELLVNGQVHLGLIDRFEGMERRELRGLEIRRLIAEPQFVALPDWDPLGEQDEVDLAQLADRDWVAPPDELVGNRLQIFSVCAEAGFTPRLTHHVNEASSARSLVAKGAVSFALPQSRSGDGIIIKSLRGAPLVVDLMLATRREGPAAGRAHDVFACAARAYHAVLPRNPGYAKWWAENPQAHPEIDAALILAGDR